MEDSFTVEVTGKDCCAATPETAATNAALEQTTITILASSPARVISLRHNHLAYPSFQTEQADAFSFHFAPAKWSACAERNLSSLRAFSFTFAPARLLRPGRFCG